MAGSKKAKPTAKIKTKAPKAASEEGAKVISTKPTKNSVPQPRNPEQSRPREARGTASASRQKTQRILRGQGKGAPSEDDEDDENDDSEDGGAVASGNSVTTSGSSDSDGSSGSDRKPPAKKKKEKKKKEEEGAWR